MYKKIINDRLNHEKDRKNLIEQKISVIPNLLSFISALFVFILTVTKIPNFHKSIFYAYCLILTVALILFFLSLWFWFKAFTGQEYKHPPLSTDLCDYYTQLQDYYDEDKKKTDFEYEIYENGIFQEMEISIFENNNKRSDYLNKANFYLSMTIFSIFLVMIFLGLYKSLDNYATEKNKIIKGGSIMSAKKEESSQKPKPTPPKTLKIMEGASGRSSNTKTNVTNKK